METNAADVFYTVNEVALLLKKSRSWVYRAARQGAITVARVGSTLRIARAEVRRLLQPVNKESVAAWTAGKLIKADLRRDDATLKAQRAKWTAKNLKAAMNPPQAPDSGQPPCR